MKFFINYRNKSNFDYDILWFVAQDIEHIKTLHSKTNKSIKINYIESSKIKNNLYKKINYTTWRKIFNFITVKVQTNREIIDDKIIYIEQHQYINTKIKNIHSIKKKDNYFELTDSIEIDAPFYIYVFQPFIKYLINKHLNSQFHEDEIFRSRLQIMKKKFGSLKNYIWLDL